MKSYRRARGLGLLALGVLSVFFSLVGIGATQAGEYLVGDRLGGRVLRYSETGTFLGVLLSDPTLGTGNTFGAISGLTLSPDQSKLYVSDRVSQRIAVYNYNGTSATFASNIVANGGSTIEVPASVLFSQDASKIYVSNIGFTASNTKVAQLTPAGVSAGADLTGGPANGRSGLAFDPNGNLLVSAFGFGASGSILRFNSGTNVFETLIGPLPELGGAANIIVQGNDLFVAAGTGGRVGKFNATTGALDGTFGTGGYITGLVFPAALALGPNGNSLLVGSLGGFSGDPASRIDQYSLGGTFQGTWANNTFAANFPGGNPGNTWFGFSEPTAIIHSTVVPEPATALLALFGMAAMGLIVRRAKRETI